MANEKQSEKRREMTEEEYLEMMKRRHEFWWGRPRPNLDEKEKK
ncbi:hypothetical protein [Bacillus sp. FJAT-52991]|uniref:Uncharacterized protein n=1 Tax=Bacillus kandeliae TaxID=3129297 RepID=A0ABZ2NA45_9BACI